jgi:hypothetical protein
MLMQFVILFMIDDDDDDDDALLVNSRSTIIIIWSLIDHLLKIVADIVLFPSRQ